MTPILLDGVQKVELDALLSVICPAYVVRSSVSSIQLTHQPVIGKYF